MCFSFVMACFCMFQPLLSDIHIHSLVLFSRCPLFFHFKGLLSRLRVAWIHIVFGWLLKECDFQGQMLQRDDLRLLQRHLNDEHFSHESISTKLTADDHFGRLLWKIFELASIKVAVIIRLVPCADLRCYRALT